MRGRLRNLGQGKGCQLLLAALLAFIGFASAAHATIDNAVTATGTLFGRPVTATATEQVDVIDALPAIALQKTGVFNDVNGNGFADLGETITYTFVVTNTGNVTLTNVALTDDKVTPAAFTLTGDAVPRNDSTDTPAAGWANLAPGDTLTAIATYPVTAADLDAVQVVNAAEVSGFTVPGIEVSATDTVTTPLTSASSLELAKTGTLDLGNGVADVGDVITYQFQVTNTGPTTLTNVKVNDPLLLVSALQNAPAVQDLIQVAAIPSDPITTASIPTGPVSVAAREPDVWSPPVPLLPASIYAERRLVRLSPSDQPFKAGDRIGVYFKLTNAGDVPLTNISVAQPGDEAFGAALDLLAPNTTDAVSILFTHVLTEEDITTDQVDFVSGITASARGKTITQTLRGPISLLNVEDTNEIATASITPANLPSLAPGAVANFSATYTLTQADIDRGEVLNTATASATNALQVVITDDASATVPVPKAPAITVEKSGLLALGTDNEASPGDLITYTFTITNTGNATLNDVRLVDPLPGLALTFTPINNFAPGDERVVTATYPITLADIAAGQVENQATASGLPANATDRVTDDSDDPATPIPNDKTIVDVPQAPKIALIKEVANIADTNGNSITDIGDTVTYRFKVKNEGNVPLTNVYVKDRDVNVVSNLLPPTGVTLAVGQEDTTSFAATYVLRQPDADRGFYDNTADVFGTAPDNSTVTDESDPAVYLQNAPTKVTIPAVPALAILKPQPTVVDNNRNTITDLGDTLNYTLRVVNTGNVTLSNIIVKDPKANNFSMTIPRLEPGQIYAVAVPVSYVVTAQDMSDGEVVNSATVESVFGGNPVRDTSDTDDITQNDPTVTPIVARPAIALVKPQPDIIDLNNNGLSDAGDQLIYNFAVTNTGNVNLNTITITDAFGPVISTRTTPLEAGDTDSTNFKLTYTITSADVARGIVTNTADVVALSPKNVAARDTSDDNVISQNDPTVTNLATLLDPKVAIVKTAVTIDTNRNNLVDVGDQIVFTFSVTNTGNTPLTNVSVADPKMTTEGVSLVPSNIVPSGLSRGASYAAMRATHVVTQADLDAGFYENQATVSANLGTRVVTDLSDDSDITADDPTRVTMSRNPALAVIKGQPAVDDVNGNGFTDAGDILTYTFEIHNTGNVTLYDVALTDDTAVIDPLIVPIPTLAPGEVDRTTYKATRLVLDRDAFTGSITNSATATAADRSGGPRNVSDISDETNLSGNAPTVTPVVKIDPILTKTAARSTVRRGERVEYTLTATQLGLGPYDMVDIMPPGFAFVPGSATVNGVAATPAQSGKTLTFANIALTRTGPRKIIVKLSLRASASTTMATGEFLNRARLYFNATGDLLAEASARVTIKEEAIFDCGEIIGRVFDDKNNNGYMDEGERGLPGVRVVTVKGLLVTTDKEGRFHVTCADVPNGQIGSNFLMKLDPRTLPAGYQLTTENPRDVRLTRGKITKLNFGASKSRDVGLDLTKEAFGPGTDLKPKYAAGMDRLVDLLKQGKGQVTITYRCGAYAPIADERLATVEGLLRAKWKQEGQDKPLNIKTRVECGN
jgi:uncharacterized repeat protein (TIGR01451 family)